MTRQLDQILVIDVEATCWEGPPPAGQENDIIEIGLCVLDVASAERLERSSLLVKPQRSQVGPFCTSLTSLTAEQVATGISFAEACKILKKKYQSKDRVWASYGDYDRRQFERQCADLGVPYPFGTSHINVKSFFGVAEGLQGELGMAGALERLGIPLEGTHHRGIDDAWNIAAVLAHILKKYRR